MPGSLAGPGGIYGVGTDWSIAAVLGLHPSWRERLWFPVAGDGCGNEYVLDASRRLIDADADAVAFVDTIADPDAPAYVCASGLMSFLRFLLERELGATGWPFDERYVLARDPGLARLREPALLPRSA